MGCPTPLVGGSPILSQPIFVTPPPAASYPAQPDVNQPPAWQPAPARPPAIAQQPAPPRPLVRAKGDDAPAAASRPARLAMPSPKQLGIAPASASPTDAVDWNVARRRLDRLGAVYFHVEKLDGGGYRFTCLLPTSQRGRTHRVETVAATEADAIHLALAKAEEWAGGR